MPYTHTQRVAPDYGRQGPLTLRHRPQEVDQQTCCVGVMADKRHVGTDKQPNKHNVVTSKHT
jgi:hypothetical protein